MEPRLSKASTRLEIKGLRQSQVNGVRIVDEGNRDEVSYDPRTIRDVMEACGVIVGTGEVVGIRRVSSEYTDLLEGLMRAYRKSNPVCTDDDNLRKIFNNRKWSKLQKILVEHDVVKLEPRSTRGQPKEFLRRQLLPAQIMAGMDARAEVDPGVRMFWDALEELSKRDLSR